MQIARFDGCTRNQRDFSICSLVLDLLTHFAFVDSLIVISLIWRECYDVCVFVYITLGLHRPQQQICIFISDTIVQQSKKIMYFIKLGQFY
jgi:hypothetical protein